MANAKSKLVNIGSLWNRKGKLVFSGVVNHKIVLEEGDTIKIISRDPKSENSPAASIFKEVKTKK